MLQGPLFEILNKFVREYLYGFNSEQLKLAFIQGNFKLHNLTFRPDKINDQFIMMRLPILLKAGIIGNITLDVNYLNPTNSELLIEDLHLIIGPNFSELKTRKHYPSNEQQFLDLSNKLDEYLRQGMGQKRQDPDTRRTDANKVLSHEHELNKIYRQASKAPETNKAEPGSQQKKPQPPGGAKETYENIKGNLPEEKQDFFSMILGLSFLAKLRVIVKNIHIRYEDDQLVPRHPISFGFLIESILIHPNPNMDVFIPSSKDSQALGYYNTEKKVLEDFWNTSKTRSNLVQKLLINNVEIYFNSSSEMYIPYSLYEETLYSPNGIFEAIPPLEVKGLMQQYLTHDDVYKFTLFKIERIELHYMISSNLKNGPSRQNFVLLSNTIYNVYLNVKPDVIEDVMDILNYFKHFEMWKHFADFKPSVRPVLNSKLINSKPATVRMRKLIIKEWWKSALWYLRVKRLIEQEREDVIPELYVEYCKSSWIKTLENFRPQSRSASSRNYVGSYDNPYTNPGEFSRPIWDQGLSSAGPKRIFPDEEFKDQGMGIKHSQPSEPTAQPRDTNELLNKMKDLLVMVFCNIYNINIALKKNNNKTFLLLRIDQSHISVLKNYDFKDNNIGTVQISNIRVFLSQSEKAKKIFEGNNPRQTHHLIQAATLSNTKQAASIQQELKEIDRVMGGSILKKDSMVHTQYSAQSRSGGQIFKDNSQFGSIVPPPIQVQQHKSQTLTPLEKLPSEGHATIFPNAMWHSDPAGQSFSKNLEGELKKTLAQPSTDLLLLELKNDIILKTETRPSAGQGIQFQTKVEINEINVKLDSDILIHIFEYYNEIQRIYYMRLVRFANYMQENYENLKFEAEKKVIGFQRPQRGSFSVNGTTQLPHGNIYSKDHLDRSQFDRSHISVDSRRQAGEDRGHMGKSNVFGSGGGQHGSEQFQPLSPTREFSTDEIFLNKLTEFLECNEILLSLNFDGLNLTLTENSHSVDNKADLMNLQLPKGKVNVSFNFNKKNAYIVDVYGFRIETSSKFKALHFLMKKIKGLVDSGMDTEHERNTFFAEFLYKKGILREQVGSQILRDSYTKHHY